LNKLNKTNLQKYFALYSPGERRPEGNKGPVVDIKYSTPEVGGQEAPV
jgi:hypothetical protein